MVTPTISTAHIRHKNQLNKHNYELIFRSYYKDETIKVESIDIDPLGVGPNAGFQSEITKISVKLNKFDSPLKIIVKEPISGSLFQKLAFRMAKPFTRETFWYLEAVPALSEKYPEVIGLSPNCYHSVTSFHNNYRYE